ncbi:MAG: cation:proton antiporter [Gemmataceae bacterium]|nr:cation:proton antiporter [Gemmataceae bacterium]
MVSEDELAGGVLFRVLAALVAILVAGRALGWLCRHLHQPPVVGEVIAGIVLGPSLLGRSWPEAMDALFPSQLLPHLAVLGQLGVILYMFQVGLEASGEWLRSRTTATLVLAAANIIVPLAGGVLLAVPLHAALAPRDVPLPIFALFMGVALAITAFPVLARILTDLKLTATDLGRLALACAAVGDAAAWCLLAVAAGAARGRWTHAVATVALAGLFVALAFFVVAPIVRRRMARAGKAGRAPFSVEFVLLGVLIAAAVSEGIGLHAVFGAFLLGAVIPANSALARRLPNVTGGVSSLLLPAFFALTGLRTQITLVQGSESWLWCGLIIVVATVGKVAGVAIPARLAGSDWRSAAALGVLMNTRGLMELIVVNIGLDLGIISPQLYAMLVVMALATTLMTTPLLIWLAAPVSPSSIGRSPCGTASASDTQS